MAKKNADIKERIAQCANELFAEQGFDKTTVEQITTAAGCSTGSFYHYFGSKEALLVVWAEHYDAEYEVWHRQVDPELHSVEKLRQLTTLSFGLTEFRASVNSASAVYIHLLQARGNYSAQNNERYFTTLLHQILKEGQSKGEIRSDISYIELGKMVYAAHRGSIMEWCLASGTYSLKEFGSKLMGMLLQGFVETA